MDRHVDTKLKLRLVEGAQTLFVGNPDGVRKKPKGRKFNKKLSPWEYGRVTDGERERLGCRALPFTPDAPGYTSSNAFLNFQDDRTKTHSDFYT